jgi:SAM-dependent methyltransferase
VTVTDLSLEDSQAAGWAATGQHTSELERAFQSHLVSRELFDRHVELRQVDMRQIPTTLRDYDFCWSVCALEHLGSIEQGLRFVEAAMDVLKPGGVAVHTTEFNFLDDEKTIDNWPTVLFQRRHFEDLHASLQTAGYRVTPLDFDVGAKPMDQFVDVPPFLHDWGDQLKGQWGAGCDHLKLLIDGYASTCFGVVVVKP